MAKKRYTCLANHRNKKTIIEILKRTEAIQISSQPTKSGSYRIFCTIKEKSVLDSINLELAKASVKVKLEEDGKEEEI